MAGIRITSERSGWIDIEKEAGRILKRSLFLLKRDRVSVDLFLVTAPTMRHLNRTFRGKNNATNILSFIWQKGFPSPDEKQSVRYLGEIVIAPAIAKKRKDHLSLLVVHGLLHLLGYTHGKVRDRIKMERMEARILKHVSPEYVFEL